MAVHGRGGADQMGKSGVTAERNRLLRRRTRGQITVGETMKFILTLLAGLYLSPQFVAGLADTRMDSRPAPTPQESAATNAGAKYAPQMEKLIHVLAGDWSTEMRYESTGVVRRGGTGHSRDSYRVGPARLSLIQEYHGEGVAGKSWGAGIIWWDAQAQGFHFVWCDTFSLDRGCRVSSQQGKWNGNDFVMTDDHEESGKRVFEKEVWSDFTANSFSQTLYVGNAPDDLKRFLTIKAKRVIKRQP